MGTLNNLQALTSTTSTTGRFGGIWGHTDPDQAWVDLDEAEYGSGRFGSHELALDLESWTVHEVEEGRYIPCQMKLVNKISEKGKHVLFECTLQSGEVLVGFLNTDKKSGARYVGLVASRPFTPAATTDRKRPPF